MTRFKNTYRVESIRLKDYDYSQPGAYFITICAKNRQCIFGNIMDGVMILNYGGHVAQQCWSEIPLHYSNVSLDAFVVMPDHIHGIIVINERHPVEANNHSPLPNKFRSPSKTVGSMVRGFKIGVTKWFRQQGNIYYVWQPNYYEHIIRDENGFNNIRDYIIRNPSHWKNKENNKQSFIKKLNKYTYRHR
ncbi:MAG: transposase [Chitinophagaceae bacterium]